ncbi:hypothetical protein PAHAL_9G276800 [Panicum hallii]|uniref:Uncharacterized protein n=1 Tax=Panicum hallii TaxID=206008 RepID=A0A2S3IMU0_9POAL|nr:hypothetical protein PAHAL_9G276800 [Panicum hallii]
MLDMHRRIYNYTKALITCLGEKSQKLHAADDGLR